MHVECLNDNKLLDIHQENLLDSRQFYFSNPSFGSPLPSYPHQVVLKRPFRYLLFSQWTLLCWHPLWARSRKCKSKNYWFICSSVTSWKFWCKTFQGAFRYYCVGASFSKRNRNKSYNIFQGSCAAFIFHISKSTLVLDNSSLIWCLVCTEE